MKPGDLIRTTSSNLPHWGKGVKGEVVSRADGGLLVDFGEAGQHVVPYNQCAEAVTKMQLFDDVEIWVCTKDEANELVRENRAEAWRIWLQDEVTQYYRAHPSELREIIEKKKQRPGPYLKKGA